MDGCRRKTVHADAADGGTSEGRQPLVDVHGVHVRDAHVAIVRRPHVRAIGHANRAYEVFRRYRGIGIRDSWAAGSSSAYSATCGLNLTMPLPRTNASPSWVQRVSTGAARSAASAPVPTATTCTAKVHARTHTAGVGVIDQGRPVRVWSGSRRGASGDSLFCGFRAGRRRVIRHACSASTTSAAQRQLFWPVERSGSRYRGWRCRCSLWAALAASKAGWETRSREVTLLLDGPRAFSTPLAGCTGATGGGEQHWSWRRSGVRRAAATLEKVRARIGHLHLVGDYVRQCRLDDLARVSV